MFGIFLWIFLIIFLFLLFIIDGRVFCVHGGLSPKIQTIDQIRLIDRVLEVPDSGEYCDLLWSDPADPNVNDERDILLYKFSSRGAGYIYGPLPVYEFVVVNQLQLICRSHQLCDEGYRYLFDDQLLTVWSAPNYCYRCGNKASVLKIYDNGRQEIKVFDEAPEAERVTPPQKPLPYYTYFQ